MAGLIRAVVRVFLVLCCSCKTSGSHGFILAQTRPDHFYNRSFHRVENISSPFITLKEYSRGQTKICTKYQLTLLFGFLTMATIIFARLTRVSSFSFDAVRFRLYSAIYCLGHCSCLRALARDWARSVLHHAKPTKRTDSFPKCLQELRFASRADL